jgi:hypothetical protein
MFLTLMPPKLLREILEIQEDTPGPPNAALVFSVRATLSIPIRLAVVSENIVYGLSVSTWAETA